MSVGNEYPNMDPELRQRLETHGLTRPPASFALGTVWECERCGQTFLIHHTGTIAYRLTEEFCLSNVIRKCRGADVR